MTERIYNVLFLCTGNSARSILAECALSRLGEGRFRAFSAGSFPKGQVHPLTIDTLRELGYPVEGLRSKSWDEFARPGSPEIDFVFTVCDKAANEVCPTWPGHPLTAHWGVQDPAAAEGTYEEKIRVFRRVYVELESRVRLFTSLPLASLDRLSLQQKLREIGQIEGATPLASARP